MDRVGVKPVNKGGMDRRRQDKGVRRIWVSLRMRIEYNGRFEEQTR